MSIAIPLPSWAEEQHRTLASLAADLPEVAPASQSSTTSLVGIRDFIATFDLDRTQSCLLSEPPGEFTSQLWEMAVTAIQTLVSLRDFAHDHFGPEQREFVMTTTHILDRLLELARTVLISRPELNLTLPADLEGIVWTVRITPLAYLRAMVNLFWSAIRHPLSETTIDLSTGRVLYRT